MKLMYALYALSDMLLVHLRDDPLFRITIPHKTLTYLASGKPVLAAMEGDFAYVLDLVQGLIKSGFYQEAVGENFNLAAGREISIMDMAKLVNETTGNKADFIYKPRRKWDTKPRLLASIEKAQKLINYRPMVEFKDGFMKNIEWFKDNWDIIENMADFPPGMSAAVYGVVGKEN